MPVPRAVNSDFFKTWSPEMAYVLGFLFADGNMSQTKRGGHYVARYTADRQLLVAIRRTMCSSHAISARRSSTGVVYRMQIGSKEMFQDLLNLGLHPGKATRMKLPDIPQAYRGDFIRGYFDGDGNVWSGVIHKKRTTSYITIQVAFTSGSREFLAGLWELLRAMGIEGGSLYKRTSGEYFRLAFSAGNALKLYEIMYNATDSIALLRKKRVFEKYIAVVV